MQGRGVGEGTRWRTVPGRVVLVPNVAEEPDLALGREHCHAQRVHGSVAISLVVEPAALVQILEIPLVGLAPEESQRPDLKVGEELTVVVFESVGPVEQPRQVVLVGVGVARPLGLLVSIEEIWVRGHELARAPPQRRKTPGVVQNRHVEPIQQVLVAHESEHVVDNVAEKVDVRFHPPVVVVRRQRRV